MGDEERYHPSEQSLPEDQLSLKKPLRRVPDSIYDPSAHVTLYGDDLGNLKKKVSYDILLKATQELEQELIEKKRAAGIQYIGCGFEDDKGIVQRGYYEHILEHALLAIMDSKAPLQEAGFGLTRPISHNESIKRMKSRNEIIILMVPPPSLDLLTVNEVIHQSLVLMRKSKDKLNLIQLASQIRI